MEVYEGAFGSWYDVCREFEEVIDLPDEVLLAVYDSELYEGYANVIYRQADRYYWVHGSHCSCYGLEGQWDPEEYSAELLIAALRRGDHFYYHGAADALRDAVIDRVLARSQLGHA
jgi:hypothetical protein